MLKKILVGLCLSIQCSLSFAKADDPFLWLENIDGDKALSWVKQMNLNTEKSLASDPLYQEIYQDALSALDSKDKLPEITQRGEWIYRLYKDEGNPRGVYQRTKLSDFKSRKSNWSVVLDIDAMSKADGVKWVFQGMECFKPSNERCLVMLSPGGTDANTLREFDLTTLKFVEDGFNLPTSKMRFSWIDHDHIYVATDFGGDSMTESGYPRISKKWRRGTPLSDAQQVFAVDPKSTWQFAAHFGNNGEPITILVEGTSFWSSRYFQYVDDDAVPLNVPNTARLEGLIEGALVMSLKEDWTFDGQLYRQGSVVLVSPDSVREGASNKNRRAPSLLVTSSPNAIVEQVTVMDHSILVTILEDVKSRVYRYRRTGNAWSAKPIELSESGNIQIVTTNNKTGEFFARYEDFLTPPTMFFVDQKEAVTKVMQQSATFDSSELAVEQRFVPSKDGTRVPYFVVMNKNTKLDGKNPTHIFSYGGFRASLTPSYSGSYEDHNGIYGKAWLERGGVFVIANIRGGGEYGPAWHAAALLENRNLAFEDFEAVAQDLFKHKITSAKHLGIEGRSNGGLLVGATMVRRPDLYGAIICGVPLLDMKRYNKLLAGASWMAEYGNPDTDDWAFMKGYSPYQNVNAKTVYPPIYFFTSTRDDRVHPGHARKMAARMQAQGHHVEYFENIEGGHKGSATSKQTAKRVALGFTHLWRHLSD